MENFMESPDMMWEDKSRVGLYAEFDGSVRHHSQVATCWKQSVSETLMGTYLLWMIWKALG